MKKLFRVSPDLLGRGFVKFAWQKEGNFIAAVGRKGVVHIFDRHGEAVDRFALPSSEEVLSLDWDAEGETLAVLQEGGGRVPLWHLSSRVVEPLDTNLKDPTWLRWSLSGSQLAICTAKGNLLIYDKMHRRMIPILAKHPAEINCGAWSRSRNELVLSSMDSTLTLSQENGDLLEQWETKAPATQLEFGWNNDEYIAANMSGSSILLINTNRQGETPVELAFNEEYGEVVKFCWFSEVYLVIAFSRGQVVMISTKPGELADELHCEKFHDSYLTDMAHNPALRRLVTAGDGGLKVIDLDQFVELSSDSIDMDDDDARRVTAVGWSPPDGQILTVAARGGHCYNYLAKLGTVHAGYQNYIAYLSSLREISIVDVFDRTGARPLKVPVSIEPAFCALGKYHVAVGMNSRAAYHSIMTGGSGSPSGRGGSNDHHDGDRGQDGGGGGGDIPPLGALIMEHDYAGKIQDIKLNDKFTAVLANGRIIVHTIDPTLRNQYPRKALPERDEGAESIATAIALTDDLLYYGTQGGTIEVLLLSKGVLLPGSEMRLDSNVEIKQIYPNAAGTRLVVLDAAAGVHLVNPVTSERLSFPEAPSSVRRVMWDLTDKNVIYLWEGGSTKPLHTYIYVPVSIHGATLTKFGPVTVSDDGEIKQRPVISEVPQSLVPIVANKQVVTGQPNSGSSMESFVPSAFEEFDLKNTNSSRERLKRRFLAGLALNRLPRAWDAALSLEDRRYWRALGGKAMQLMNVDLATRVYRQSRDAAMVMALEAISHVEDKNLLAGHIFVLFCDYDRAQELFLASSQPVAALELRKALMQHEQALKLAASLAPEQTPGISVKYAQQLELREDYDGALRMYEGAFHETEDDTIRTTAQSGMARCNLRMGNLRVGMRLAEEVQDQTLFRECAAILDPTEDLEGIGGTGGGGGAGGTGADGGAGGAGSNSRAALEAAELYVKGEQFDKAARVYFHDKAFERAGPIMDRVTLPPLHAIFAKACKAKGKYADAVVAFTRAHDMVSVVDLYLGPLDEPQKAFEIVRETKNPDGAKRVAEYCVRVENNRGAIEFLLLAGQSTEAFQLAKDQECVDVYAEVLGDRISPDDAKAVAAYFEKNQDLLRAGRFYRLNGDYAKAMRLFLGCGDAGIENAIDVVGHSRDDALAAELIDFLMGERDGVAKNPQYIFKLYIARRDFVEADKTADLIAHQEQDLGNYSVAHGILFECIRALEDESVHVSQQIRQRFTVLHSYTLAKKLVARGDHTGAARLLQRVAVHVSSFPLHIVSILTSAVVECMRAGLKASAYNYATQLMQPEHRQNIDARFRRKVEGLVRKSGTPATDRQDPAPELSECPVSGQMIDAYALECPTTRDALPMCVVTGKHMVLDNWTICPVSRMPALYSEYLRYIQTEEQAQTEAATAGTGVAEVGQALDPVCGKPVRASDLVKVSKEEGKRHIISINMVGDDEDENGNETKDEDNDRGDTGTGGTAGAAENSDDSIAGDLDDSQPQGGGDIGGSNGSGRPARSGRGDSIWVN